MLENCWLKVLSRVILGTIFSYQRWVNKNEFVKLVKVCSFKLDYSEKSQYILLDAGDLICAYSMSVVTFGVKNSLTLKYLINSSVYVVAC